MLVVICPSCRHKLRPPDHLAGRRVTCPNCNEAVRVPVPVISEEEAANAPAPEEPTDEQLPVPVRLGLTAMILGLGSILVLCLPFIGYLSFVLSGAGLLLALWGLLRALLKDRGTPAYHLAGGVRAWGSFGTRARDYPLAGIAACLLALVLALLPTLLR